MFRPPPFQTQGGPPRLNAPFSGHSAGMSAGPPFAPHPFPMHGRGGFHSTFQGGRHHGFPPSGTSPSLSPPAVPSSTQPDGYFRSTSMPAPPPPPPMPKDPEMLKNIEVLSSFVVKNGPQFENMARAKQAGDPKFAFLFGGERGSEAALGFDFYNWKKEHLTWVEARNKAGSGDQQKQFDSNILANLGEPRSSQFPDEPPASPTGSDMDMEDDIPSERTDEKAATGKTLALPSTAAERRSSASPPAEDGKPASDKKAVVSFKESAALMLGSSSQSAVDHQTSQAGRSKGLSGQPLVADLVASRSKSHGDRSQMVADVSKSEREVAPPDLPKRRDTRRRTGFDRSCMEEVSVQHSPVKHEHQKDAVHGREVLPAPDFDHKVSSSNGHREGGNRHSRWDPLEHSDHVEGGVVFLSETNEGKSLGKGSKKVDTYAQNRETVLSKDRGQSPDSVPKSLRTNDDHNAKDPEKRSKSRSDKPAVDEFGRLRRKGGTDSDEDDEKYRSKKRKRTSSRSRSASRSPEDLRSKHWGHSQHLGSRRSGSWSRSPRRSSRTPPRESWRGGDGRGDRSGRRGGRSAGGTVLCFDFLKGKCFRGASCRFLHEENNEGTSNQSWRSGGAGGRGRGQSYTNRESGSEVDRARSGKSREVKTKVWRTWESDELTREGDSRQLKVVDEITKEGQEFVPDESTRQDKCNSESLLVQHTKELGQCGDKQPVTSPSQSSPKGIASATLVSPVIQSQSNLSTRVLSESQTIVLPGPTVSKKQSGFSANSISSIHDLGSVASNSISQQLSYMVSPTPHSQQLQLSSPTVSHPPLPVFSSPLQLQSPGYNPSPSAGPQGSMGFASNTSHQQPSFSSTRTVVTESSLLPTLQPPPSARQVSFPQASFNFMQQPNLSPFSNLEHGGSQFRQTGGSAQPPPVTLSPPNPNFSLRPILSWVPGSVGTPVSSTRPLQVPSSPVQHPAPPQSLHTQPVLSMPLHPMQPLLPPRSQSTQPPHLHSLMPPVLQPLPPPPQSLQPPQQSIYPSPLQHPPAQSLQQLPPPVVSTAPTVYSYNLPLSYPMHSFSTSSSRPLAPPPISKDQYDPLADSLEPAPPGSAKKTKLRSNQISPQENTLQTAAKESWRHLSVSAPLMTNAGEVVLENVSPGLPGHADNVALGSAVIGARLQDHLIMENVSPTNIRSSLKENVQMIVGGSQGRAIVDSRGTMDMGSPTPQNPMEAGSEIELSAKFNEQKKKDKDGRFLNLIRKAVAEHVKELLKPTWKGGHLSKDAFKTIAKKAVDKIMGALEAKGQIPKSQEKMDSFMETSKPKIAKLVQGYVDKYGKT